MNVLYRSVWMVSLFLLMAGMGRVSASDGKGLLERVERLQQQNRAKAEAAFSAMEAVQQAGAYIESLSDLFGDGIVTLPVGIKKGDYELIIQRIAQDKSTGRSVIYATCAFRFPDSGQAIVFEGSAVLEGQKGLGTSGYLRLLSPVRRDMGSELTLVFDEGTRVNFGCEGIESFFARMQLLVTGDRIIPVDAQGVATGGAMMTQLEASFRDFDAFTVSFGFNQSFQLAGLKDVIFTLKGATLDQSDAETSAMVQFPEGYFSGSPVEGRALWKGVSITEAEIALPAIFKNPAAAGDGVADKRLRLGLSRVIWDENGFSGEVMARDIFNSSIIDQSRWDITVTDFSLAVLRNAITGMGFGGDINMPPLGKNSLLPYQATYNHSTRDYEFMVGVSGKYDFPVLRSTLTLDPTSRLTVAFKDSEIYPTLLASGQLTVDAPLDTTGQAKKFSVPDIAFQNMVIKRDSPYFEPGTFGVTGDLVSPSVGGFELSVTDIRSFQDGTGSGLGFTAGIKLSDMFGGAAGLKLYGDYSRWKFRHVAIDSVSVKFQSNAYSLLGNVVFKNGDAIYGSGFRGDLKLSVINQFTFDAVGVFGKKDDYRYFLTDVFYETSPTSGLPFPPPAPVLTFYGVGGGMYRRMQQTTQKSGSTEFGKSLSNIHYVPDKQVGMGFMASTKFGLIGAPKGFNAKVGFEMQFNDHGGVNFVQLRGDAAFMDDPDKWGKLADNINQQTRKLEQGGGQLKLAAKSDLAVPENQSSGFLTASMNVKYDLQHSVFTADLRSYLNAGFIRGVGENNCMGWASAYFSKDKWYTYIGTPTNPLGTEIMGLARSSGYFMVGDDIPELPPPPKEVLKNFSKAKQDQLNKRNMEDMASGRGIAFGQAYNVSFKATLPPFYASLGVGLGAEFLLKNYGLNAYCAGGTPPLGFQGWYAEAQAWAWVDAEIGIETTLFWKDYRLSILDMSASALLAGAGPNPFYFTGAVGGRFSVMGGLISGQCDFDFEIGEKCKKMGGSPFGMEVIAQLTPGEGDKAVNVFASPQALFNIPIDLEMKVEEDDGKYALYKVSLESFDVKYKANGQVVDGFSKKSGDAKVYLLDPAEPFESNKEMLIHAKVSFNRSIDGKSWHKVTGADGKPLFEEKMAAFTSGERPKEILPEHVKYSYPVARQYNYYPDEYRNGYVMVTENYAYLFTTEKPVGFNQLLRLTNVDGNKQETSFTHKTFAAGNDIRFEINFSTQGITFAPDEIYKMAIVNVPQQANAGMTSNITSKTTNLAGNDSIQLSKQQAEGTLAMLEEKEIYGLHFRTSAHKTFKAKMDHMEGARAVMWQEYAHVYQLGTNLDDKTASVEMWDDFETRMPQAEDNLVHAFPKYASTSWYKNAIESFMYGNADLMSFAGKAGLQPPVEVGVAVFNQVSKTISLSDDMISANTRASVSPYGVVENNAPYYIDRDYLMMRNILANKIIGQKMSNASAARFLSSNNIPDQTKGNYPLIVQYKLPGKKIVTTEIERNIIAE